MAPTTTLEELIATVEGDARSQEALRQLAQASATVSELAELGDELLEHFVGRCRSQGYTWTEISGALGVTKQAAHKRFSLAQPSKLDRFTPRANIVLEDASTEARRLGHGYVGTEHLLLGLFATPESIAARILDEMQVTKESAEGIVIRLVGRGSGDGGSESEGEPNYTDRAMECLRQAVAEALRLRHNYVGTEHILLGLFGDPVSVAARALAELGVAEEGVRSRILAMLEESLGKRKS